MLIDAVESHPRRQRKDDRPQRRMRSGRLLRPRWKADHHRSHRTIGLDDLDLRTVLESGEERIARSRTDPSIEAIPRVVEDGVDVALAVGEEVGGLVVEDGVTREWSGSPLPEERSEPHGEPQNAGNRQAHDKGLGRHRRCGSSAAWVAHDRTTYDLDRDCTGHRSGCITWNQSAGTFIVTPASPAHGSRRTRGSSQPRPVRAIAP